MCTVKQLLLLILIGWSLTSCSVWMPAPSPIGSERAEEIDYAIHSLGYVDIGFARVYGSRTHLDGPESGILCAVDLLPISVDYSYDKIRYQIQASESWLQPGQASAQGRLLQLKQAFSKLHALFTSVGLPSVDFEARIYLLPEGCDHDSLVLTFFAAKPIYYLIFSKLSVPDVGSTIVHEIAHIAIREKHTARLPSIIQETIASAVELLFSLRVFGTPIPPPENDVALYDCDNGVAGLNYDLGRKLSAGGRQLASVLMHEYMNKLNNEESKWKRIAGFVRRLVANPSRYVCTR